MNVFAGLSIDSVNTDIFIDPSNGYTEQLNAYYDLRDRKTYIQITNADTFENQPVVIHVQIFQHDRDCDELNFFDELTVNDTVIYDLDNIIKNDGSSPPISLLDDSYGYVVITAVTPADNEIYDDTAAILGNFRIVDDKGYEYRTNMQNTGLLAEFVQPSPNGDFQVNINNVDGANQADIVGFVYRKTSINAGSVLNVDEGVNLSVFVFDLDEEPLSCDVRNFACGNIMNYGVNDDYGASRGDDLLCEGGSLPDPNGGYILFENLTHVPPTGESEFYGSGSLFNFAQYIGLNNDDNTGSMDSWITKYD